MTQELRLESTIQFERHRRGTKKVVPASDEPIVRGKLPRVARLMALAIHLDRLVRNGEIHDYAELAEQGNVTRARVTQIMNLTNLAPEIQEELLFLPRISEGRDTLILRQFQKIAARLSWREQKREWKLLKAAAEL